MKIKGLVPCDRKGPLEDEFPRGIAVIRFYTQSVGVTCGRGIALRSATLIIEDAPKPKKGAKRGKR